MVTRSKAASFSVIAVIGVVLVYLLNQRQHFPGPMDTDGSGDIEFAEWKEFHLDRVDSDGNSILSVKEWNEFYWGGSTSIDGWKDHHFASIDINQDGFVSLTEWKNVHSVFPVSYGGKDSQGYIEDGSDAQYYREFKRVDCNGDWRMDLYEYHQLRWNLRWC